MAASDTMTKHHIPAPDAQQRRTGLAAFLGGVLPLFSPTGVPAPDKAELGSNALIVLIRQIGACSRSGSTVQPQHISDGAQYAKRQHEHLCARYEPVQGDRADVCKKQISRYAFHMETALRSILLLLSVTRLLG